MTPELDLQEPGRTQRALGRFLKVWPTSSRHMRPGDAMAELHTWLGVRGLAHSCMWHAFASTTGHLTLAALTGLSYSLQWSKWPAGSQALVGILLAFHLLMAGCSLSAAVISSRADRLDWLARCVASLLEAAASGVLLAACVLAEHAKEEDGMNLQTLTHSLELVYASTQILMAALLVPTVALVSAAVLGV